MPRPGAVDPRLVLRAYTWVASAAGLVILFGRWQMPPSFAGAPVDREDLWRYLALLAGNLVWISGTCAATFARIEDPVARRQALRLLAGLLLFAGLFYFSPAWPIARVIPFSIAAPVIASGLVLLYLSWQPRRRRTGPLRIRGAMVVHDKLSITGRYEESIRQAARQEERARLARDLHDAVKQQLFVIQTAAATVEQRFDSDHAGAQAALGQVRESARDALTEMEVMLEQLQAVPIGNAGLIESLKRQCEVLRFRTAADVQFVPGELPPESAFAPGAHQAMLRFAQEALANVARHARAHHVTVFLGREGPHVRLSITDDGQGFDMHESPRGMGLTSMGGRAAEAEGTYVLQSTPGGGTTVSLILDPYAPQRSMFMGWAIACAILMLAMVVLLITVGPRALTVVITGEIVCAAVGIHNAVAWWKARQWP
jgi:signal transduction histidine kinase